MLVRMSHGTTTAIDQQSLLQRPRLKLVLWIRFGFNADPDPAFYLNADPDTDPDPESQTNADPAGSGAWSDF
jgi:hypothetical protein